MLGSYSFYGEKRPEVRGSRASRATCQVPGRRERINRRSLGRAVGFWEVPINIDEQGEIKHDEPTACVLE